MRLFLAVLGKFEIEYVSSLLCIYIDKMWQISDVVLTRKKVFRSLFYLNNNSNSDASRLHTAQDEENKL
jgi:hypothetical protein